jgi:hypothetical protein
VALESAPVVAERKGKGLLQLFQGFTAVEAGQQVGTPFENPGCTIYYSEKKIHLYIWRGYEDSAAGWFS